VREGACKVRVSAANMCVCVWCVCVCVCGVCVCVCVWVCVWGGPRYGLQKTEKFREQIDNVRCSKRWGFSTEDFIWRGLSLAFSFKSWIMCAKTSCACPRCFCAVRRMIHSKGPKNSSLADRIVKSWRKTGNDVVGRIRQLPLPSEASHSCKRYLKMLLPPHMIRH